MDDASTAPLELEIEGMTCDDCSARVEGAVKELAGVESCTVNLTKGLARVMFDAAMVTPRRIIQAIRATGYEARMMG